VSSQGYTSDGEPPTSGDELSEEEDGLPRKQTHMPQSKSTWSRWFSRGWVDRQSQRPSVAAPDLEAGSRPLMQLTLSEPFPVRYISPRA
jgi:hypothetical protein